MATDTRTLIERTEQRIRIRESEAKFARENAEAAGGGLSRGLLHNAETAEQEVALLRDLLAALPQAQEHQQALDAREFAQGAILDAIGLEDGLDGAAGHAVVLLIRDALKANGREVHQLQTAGEECLRVGFANRLYASLKASSVEAACLCGHPDADHMSSDSGDSPCLRKCECRAFRAVPPAPDARLRGSANKKPKWLQLAEREDAREEAQLKALDRARAVMIRALDALESTDRDARCEAFEMIQQEFEGVSEADHSRAEALIPQLKLEASLRAHEGEK
jgi:hypothetical protein